jgi:rhamnosyltransferase
MNAGQSGIAGVVVLFHPPPAVWENIRTYASGLDLLILVDNSAGEGVAARAETEFPGCIYLRNPKNLGIAAALNQGAGLAIDRGFRWLLTMDQDSRFEAGAFAALAAAREGLGGHVGILAPSLKLHDGDDPEIKEAWTEPRVAMTSGNLLNLGAYAKIGPFLEFLFIDYVDHEYCLRLKRKGYRVRRINAARLRHSLGQTEIHSVLGLSFRPTHHPAHRRYYMTRNRLYVIKKYPSFLLPEAFAWAKELFKMILFESARIGKFRSIARGVIDFLRGRYGSIENPVKIGRVGEMEVNKDR